MSRSDVFVGYYPDQGRSFQVRIITDDCSMTLTIGDAERMKRHIENCQRALAEYEAHQRGLTKAPSS